MFVSDWARVREHDHKHIHLRSSLVKNLLLLDLSLSFALSTILHSLFPEVAALQLKLGLVDALPDHEAEVEEQVDSQKATVPPAYDVPRLGIAHEVSVWEQQVASQEHGSFIGDFLIVKFRFFKGS